MHNIVPRLSKTPGAIRTPAPKLGEHTDAILSEVGLTKQEILDLKGAGIVA
jgi:crotonobetainyl-CoA:carnitine CoA-transferase CaiB-like acyl-CoA transferase